MEFIKRHRRYILTLVAILFAGAFLTNYALGQMKARPGKYGPVINMTDARVTPRPGPMLCPNPVTLNLAAPATAPGMNNPNPNNPVAYTFVWRTQSKCCQYLSASVTIKYTADQSGGWNDSTSGNDLIGIVGMPSRHLYPQNGGAVAGQHYSMTIPLTASALASLNNTLKVTVEDDTQVTSLTLNISACCLKNGIST